MNFDAHHREGQQNRRNWRKTPHESSKRKKKGFWEAARHYVVRTPENGGSPHLLKTNLLFIFLGFVLLSQAALLSGLLNRAVAYLPSFQNMLASVLPGVLSVQTNDYRQENRVGSLKQNALLAEAAQMKADDMAAKGYFAHIGPNNEKPWVWMQKVGYSYAYAGENLAINFVDSSDVTKAWINSPAHKKNLINPNFTETGIGTAEGKYEGKETTFVVQFFASPVGGSKPSPAGTMLAVAKPDADALAKTNTSSTTAASKPVTLAKADAPASTSVPVKPASEGSAIEAASSTLDASSTFATFTASSTENSTGTSTDTASSSVLASAQNPNNPEVLGLESSDPSLGAAAGSIGPAAAQGGFMRMFTTLFVHPKDVAKKVLFGAMVLVSLLLLVSMSHSIAYPMARGAGSASFAGSMPEASVRQLGARPNFISRISHSLLVHKKSAFEVACVLLVMLSVWSLGKTAQLDTVQTSTAIGADSESL